MSGSVDDLVDVARAEFRERFVAALALHVAETRGSEPDVERLLLLFRDVRDRAMREVAFFVGQLFDCVREQRFKPGSDADADARFLSDWSLDVAQSRLRSLWSLSLERGAVVAFVDELLPEAVELAKRPEPEDRQP